MAEKMGPPVLEPIKSKALVACTQSEVLHQWDWSKLSTRVRYMIIHAVRPSTHDVLERGKRERPNGNMAKRRKSCCAAETGDPIYSSNLLHPSLVFLEVCQGTASWLYCIENERMHHTCRVYETVLWYDSHPYVRVSDQPWPMGPAAVEAAYRECGAGPMTSVMYYKP